VSCPDGAGAGEMIQVVGPSVQMPTVAGVPVGNAAAEACPTGVAAGVAVGGHPNNMNMHMMAPDVPFVEVDEISPAGWLCLIVGCFACPGPNLLGLCMRERRLVPVTQVY
jgi:hypothetical protein